MEYSKYDNTNIYNKFTDNDKEELNLLSIQHIADIIFIISDILSYIATLESVDLIYSKYNDKLDIIPNPDIPVLQSALLSLLARMLYNQVGFTRYSHLVERKMNGEIDYSLSPNININTGNVLKTAGTFYGLMAAIEIFNRDLQQPIFGV